jgi:hypothetical protein
MHTHLNTESPGSNRAFQSTTGQNQTGSNSSTQDNREARNACMSQRQTAAHPLMPQGTTGMTTH